MRRSWNRYFRTIRISEEKIASVCILFFIAQALSFTQTRGRAMREIPEWPRYYTSITPLAEGALLHWRTADGSLPYRKECTMSRRGEVGKKQYSMLESGLRCLAFNIIEQTTEPWSALSALLWLVRLRHGMFFVVHALAHTYICVCGYVLQLFPRFSWCAWYAHHYNSVVKWVTLATIGVDHVTVDQGGIGYCTDTLYAVFLKSLVLLLQGK